VEQPFAEVANSTYKSFQDQFQHESMISTYSIDQLALTLVYGLVILYYCVIVLQHDRGHYIQIITTVY